MIARWNVLLAGQAGAALFFLSNEPVSFRCVGGRRVDICVAYKSQVIH